jgi:hypothetical protein
LPYAPSGLNLDRFRYSREGLIAFEESGSSIAKKIIVNESYLTGH